MKIIIFILMLGITGFIVGILPINLIMWLFCKKNKLNFIEYSRVITISFSVSLLCQLLLKLL